MMEVNFQVYSWFGKRVRQAKLGDSRENSIKGASLSRKRAEMFLGDEPAAIDPAQNGGAASAA